MPRVDWKTRCYEAHKIITKLRGLLSKARGAEEANGSAMSAALEGHAAVEAKLTAEIAALKKELHIATYPPEEASVRLIAQAKVDAAWVGCDNTQRVDTVTKAAMKLLNRPTVDEAVAIAKWHLSTHEAMVQAEEMLVKARKESEEKAICERNDTIDNMVDREQALLDIIQDLRKKGGNA